MVQKQENPFVLMKRIAVISTLVTVLVAAASCTKGDGVTFVHNGFETSAVFNLSVSELVSPTKVSSTSNNTSIQPGFVDNVAFGLVGSDPYNGTLGIKNVGIFATASGVRSCDIISEHSSSNTLVLNAYYPFANEVDCHEDGSSIINFTQEDLQLGPMVSNNVNINCNQEANIVNFDFHHIANRLGFKVCDITPDEQLRNHMHVRKIQLYGVSVKGQYVNEGTTSYWVPQHSSDPVVIYQGNEKVEFGKENSLYVKPDGLSDKLEDASRMVIIPEYLDTDKYIEVIIDTDEFEYDGTHYSASTGRAQKISFADAIPENTFNTGIPYTFTLGLNIEEFYMPIDFTASVEEFENNHHGHILDYENE